MNARKRAEQAESLVSTILHGPTMNRATALFNLIKAASDPKGDQTRYWMAEEAMRAIDPQTKEYEAWVEKRIAVKTESPTKRKAVR